LSFSFVFPRYCDDQPLHNQLLSNEVVCGFETVVTTRQSACCHVPEVSRIH
jgi:hypothetical protein